MNPQIEQFVKEIRQRLPAHGSPESAANELRSFIVSVTGTFSPEMESNLAEALGQVQSTLQKVEILRRNSLTKTRDDWYPGPAATDQHWPALQGYLRNAKNWDHESIGVIDESSSEVVSLLANPAEEQFRCRGLVVGYVQSGKTANMTAVIAKAVDAGYNLIVLLGGVTNKLRAQTQRRLLSDIVERHRHMWQLYTTVDDDGDFARPPNGQFTMPVTGRAQLVVMKKWTSRLNAFLQTVERTPPTVLRSLKTLIIDDECDQASVNSSSKEHDMTSINEAIRKIIRALPAVSYVGYTATPFANVFINPFPHNKDELDDLYPEDFITDLPRPKDYFGAREVFGFDPVDAANDEGASAGRDMIRIILADEVAKVRPASNKDRGTFMPAIAKELERALLWFLITSALRRRRGQAGSHMTMLVHTSPNVNQHTRMAESIRAWLTLHADAIRNASGGAWDLLKEVWALETDRVPLEGKDENSLDPDGLLPWLKEVLGKLEVAVENGESVERLNYADEAKTYIVVGGSVLARGLTLEGLCVSYFLRTSQQYDTLLQMGRWFGFRHGYSELPRLWVTQDLVSNFRALARIEEEIREDIAFYRERKASPLEFAVKVRQIPGLAITSAAKMRHAYRTSISFEGKHVQTIRFDHRKDGIVSSNWSAASRFIDEAKAKGKFDHERGVFEAVPLASVRKFLLDFQISDQHLDLKQDMLLSYLDKAAAGLGFWNVAVVGPERGQASSRALGFLGNVPTNRRSRLAESGEYADIKALMSMRDILVDADDSRVSPGDKWKDLKGRRPQVPLLLLYPIEAESKPSAPTISKDGRPTRVALDAVDDLIGFGIVFPGALDRSGGYYSVELDVPTPEQLEDDGSQGDENG
ncbi:Z1 domain-containing protein [Lysobacter niastensis]|uniref:Z1 domain-containing protein n=1 Tax=Lysobacter niastensis TaxID=380629 RepID=A0ABS0B8K3_9GAMM|nr:Z1 domain-containing protein [Lysobacter niastensis]MBF6025344.1 Z1 domain-containing protein [Lysobacter niastensis]